jgi:hypothetical protein
MGAGFRKDKEFPEAIAKVSHEAVEALAKRLLKDFTSLTLLPQ